MSNTSQNPPVNEATLQFLGPARQVELDIPRHLMGLVHPYRSASGKFWSRLSTHKHDELELNFITRGHCTLLIKNRKVQLTPGTMIWILPDQDHLYYNTSPDLEKWVTVFRPEFLNESISDTTMQPLMARDTDSVLSRNIGHAAIQHLEMVCQRLDDGADGFPIPHYNLGLGWLLHEAWAAYTQATDGQESAHIHPAVQRAALHLERRPETESVPVLAQVAGLSPSRLSRLFREQMGVSVTDFRNARRVERFLQIYRPRGRYSITEAAFVAGFQSYPQFHRVFSKSTGHSPSGYFKKPGTH